MTMKSACGFFISEKKIPLKPTKESSQILVDDQGESNFNQILENALFERSGEDYEHENSSPTSLNSSKSQRFLAYASKRSKSGRISLNTSIEYLFKQASETSDCQPQRPISSFPLKVLDAPGLLDDYYLNLMDWGSSNYLAIALNNNLYLWNDLNSEITRLMPENDKQLTSVNFMKNGGCLATGFIDSNIELWDLEKGRLLRTLSGHGGRVSSLSWNSYILSSGSKDTEIINHDVRSSNHIISRLKGHSQEVCGLKWSLDFTNLASGSNDNSLIIWELNMNLPKFRLQDHKGAVKALAWCPWQKNLLASGGGSADKCIKFWNCEMGTMLKSQQTESQVSSLIWNQFDKELLSSHGYLKNQLTLWKYPKMNKIIELKGHMNRVLQMSENPDGEVVVSAGADETLRFWKVFERKELKEEIGENGGVKFLKKSNLNLR